jgi:hypothetical protein
MKKIDISTQEGLDELKEKAKYYGHYAEALQVLDLIGEIERNRADPQIAANEAAKRFADQMVFGTTQVSDENIHHDSD